MNKQPGQVLNHCTVLYKNWLFEQQERHYAGLSGPDCTDISLYGIGLVVAGTD